MAKFVTVSEGRGGKGGESDDSTGRLRLQPAQWAGKHADNRLCERMEVEPMCE